MPFTASKTAACTSAVTRVAGAGPDPPASTVLRWVFHSRTGFCPAAIRGSAKVAKIVSSKTAQRAGEG